jgi:hypothetical protein
LRFVITTRRGMFDYMASCQENKCVRRTNVSEEQTCQMWQMQQNGVNRGGVVIRCWC